MSYRNVVFLLGLVCFLVGCNQTAQEQSTIRVELIDGNVRRTYVYQEAITVDEFLKRVEANVTDLDRVAPQRFTQIYDGITITIVRVQEEVSCFEDVLPFQTERYPSDALEAGAEVIMQAGQNGTERVCERCIFENGVQSACNESGSTIITDAKPEIIYFGAGGVDVPVEVEGKLAYIAGYQAWIIEGNAINRRVLTTAGQLDGRVFDLSANGRQLLYTALTDNPSDLQNANELWAILDTGNPAPVALEIENVLSGQWMPNEAFTISYSTMDPQTTRNGYQAYNDVWKMRIDSRTGQTVDLQNVVELNSIGLHSYWGTNYRWSPDGQQLAWARADSIGLVDLASGEQITLATFPHFDTAIIAGWVWQPEISWSQDSQMLITTLHGAPYGEESAVNSIIFNTAVLSPTRNMVIDALISRTGVWSQPRYSPISYRANFPEYQIAYLQARDPLNSLSSEYDLMIADRDGSNPHVIFPAQGRSGLDPFGDQGVEFVWSPSGRHIAIIYQGNLWVVEVATGLAQQLTADGQASRPRWTN